MGQRRDRRVEVRMTSDELAEVHQYAFVLETSVSGVIRLALAYLSGRELVDPRSALINAIEEGELSADE